MKALVVYASAYGNTQSVAEAISGALNTRIRMFIHSDAAGKIARALKAGGADIIADPMPFYVRGSEGPLRDGEIEKAESWARTLLASVTS